MDQPGPSRSESCAKCGKPCTMQCSSCKIVFYCSRECQKGHRKTHKAFCLGHQVKENAELGRHLIATRDYNLFDGIFNEAPLVVAPTCNDDDKLNCLGCHELKDLRKTRCRRCKMLICAEKCSKSPLHEPECYMLRTFGPTKINKSIRDKLTAEMIIVLRCLYLKETNPTDWIKFMALRQPANIMKDGVFEALVQTAIPAAKISNEEISTVLAIFLLNKHTILRDHNAVYYSGSLLEHNCVPNCFKRLGFEGKLVVAAARPIKKGEHLSFCYTEGLAPTRERKATLMNTYYLECFCARCEDPTELGTHFHSIRCTTTKCNGFVHPTSDPREWICDLCEIIQLYPNNLKKFVEEAEDNLPGDSPDFKVYLEFIRRFENTLHPNHYLLASVKIDMICLVHHPESLPGELLEEMLRHCLEMKKLMTIIAPAVIRRKGAVYFRYYTIIKEIADRKVRRELVETNKLSKELKEDYMKTLLECQDVLDKCCALLANNCEDQMYRPLFEAANRSLDHVRTLILLEDDVDEVGI